MLKDSKWKEIEKHLDSIFNSDFDVTWIIKFRIDKMNGKMILMIHAVALGM